MARTARYENLPSWNGDSFEVTITKESAKGEKFSETVSVPKLVDLQSAMQVFGGETGPSTFEDGKSAKPSLLSFLQDAVEEFVTRGARARVTVKAKGPEKIIASLVAKMVKAGIAEDVATEFATKQILG